MKKYRIVYWDGQSSTSVVLKAERAVVNERGGLYLYRDAEALAYFASFVYFQQEE